MAINRKTGDGMRSAAWGVVSLHEKEPRFHFGIHGTKKKAKEWAKGTTHVVVPVVIAVGVMCGMPDCRYVHTVDWGKKK